MRNLKRTLSLAMAAVMLLGMMVVGASAVSIDDFSDSSKIVNTEAVSILTTLGVINGKDDGSFDPTGIVTRAEMAKMICVILNGGKDPNLSPTATTSYTDTANNWASAYIEYCSNLGIVSGDGTGKFNPSATVTGSEAAKMILVAMGFNATYEKMVGPAWSSFVDTLANGKNLYVSIDANPGEGLTRDNAAQMIYNSLDEELVTYKSSAVVDGSGNWTTINERNDREDITILTERFKAVKVEGVVTSNEYASVNGANAAKDGETTVIVSNYQDGQNEFKNVANTFKVSSGDDVIGRAVYLYVKPGTSAAKSTVIGGVILDEGANTVVTNTAKKTNAKVQELLDDNNLTLSKSGDSTHTQHSTNYGTPTALDGKLTGDTVFNRKGVELTIIDNDGDGVADYIFQVEYKLGKVTKYSTKDDGSLTLNASSALAYDKSEKVIGFDDVKKDDYVLYAEIGGKLYVEKAKEITGDLTAYKTDSSVTVDGTKYDTSAVGFYTDGGNLTDANKVTALDKEATFYFDKFDNAIAAGDVKGSSSDSYAFVRNVWSVTNDNGENILRASVVLDDGTSATYPVDDSNDSDGTPVSDVANGNKMFLATYSINGDDEIALKKCNTPGNDTLDDKKVAISKGKASITLDTATKYGDSDTVYFYIAPKGVYNPTSTLMEALSVDEVNVYVGKDSAPSMTMNNTDADYVLDGTTVKAVAVVTDGIGSDSDFLYLYDKGSKTSDGTIYSAIIDGEMKDITVTNTVSGLGLYKYSTSTKGYKVTAIPATSATLGNVEVKDGNTVIIDSTEYTLTNDTVIAMISGSDTELEAAVNKGDYVWVKAGTGDDKELQAVYVIMAYDSEKVDLVLNAAGEAAGAALDGDKVVLDSAVSVDTLKTYFDVNGAVAGANVKVFNGASEVTGVTAVADDYTVVVTYDKNISGNVSASQNPAISHTYTIDGIS